MRLGDIIMVDNGELTGIVTEVTDEDYTITWKYPGGTDLPMTYDRNVTWEGAE